MVCALDAAEWTKERKKGGTEQQKLSPGLSQNLITFFFKVPEKTNV